MKKNIYFICVLCMATLISCESEKLDILNYGTINGVVLDGETYLPLQGAMISTTPASIVILSDSNGNFTIPKVIEGDIAVNVKKNNYLSNSLTVAVFKNQSTQMNFLIFKDESTVGNISIYDPVPGNGAVDQNLEITFNWNIDGNTTYTQLTYNIYIFESNSTVQQLLGENIELKQVTTSGLKNSTTYYWYVVAKYNGTKVGFSPTWSFRTLDK